MENNNQKNNQPKNINRRSAIGFGLTGLLSIGLASNLNAAGKGVMPWQWIEKEGKIKKTDGTPLQFMPKTAKDSDPLKNELKKYPRCPYCGMSRKMWNHTRHLIHYSDGRVDATCSIHCASLSLGLNLDLQPKAIYAADASDAGKIKPMVNVDKATYLVGAKQKGTMSANSKWAYGSKDKASEAMKKLGGKTMDFNGALTSAYLDMAKDTIMIRKRRATKRMAPKKAMGNMKH